MCIGQLQPGGCGSKRVYNGGGLPEEPTAIISSSSKPVVYGGGIGGFPAIAWGMKGGRFCCGESSSSLVQHKNFKNEAI